MPIHDWTRVGAGIFHDFHHEWVSEISRSLNSSLKGTEHYALIERISGKDRPKPLAMLDSGERRAVTAVAESPIKTRFRITNPPLWYANTKKAVTIRHVSEHRVVAVLEIISPGNKASRSAMTAFVRKAQDLLAAGVHLDLIDLFPPTPRDPEGIHDAVWGEDDTDVFHFDPAKPLTCASYIGGVGAEAFVEPIAVGDVLPEIPLFLTPEEYIDVPLESTYLSAFDAVPEVWRDALMNPDR